MNIRVALVTCVKSKRPSDTAARDLYTSTLFRSLRGYAERTTDKWYILSAEHGLLHPDQTVAPYEKTLNTMKRADRLAWAARVQQQLLQVLPPKAEIVILAGVKYRDDLIPFLREHGFSVSVPFEGLSFGKQLQRLKQLAASGYDER